MFYLSLVLVPPCTEKSALKNYMESWRKCYLAIEIANEFIPCLSLATKMKKKEKYQKKGV